MNAQVGCHITDTPLIEHRSPSLTDERAKRQHYQFRLDRFSGDLRVFYAAGAAYSLASDFGWRIAYAIYVPRTIRRYESILDLRFRDCCPEYTHRSPRTSAFEPLRSASNFWKFVKSRPLGSRGALVSGEGSR